METLDWVAWAAGLFEGEGCITSCRQLSTNGRYTYQPKLSLEMTDKEIVEKFTEVTEFKGVIYVRVKSNPKHKTTYSWTLSRKKDCKDVLQLLWPYLGERRRAQAIELGLQPKEVIE
jgi:hypothetical protein